MMLRRSLWAVVWLALLPTLAFAQQTGRIGGKVVGSDGLVLPGVTVEARSTVMPTPRVSVTGGNGDYQLPQLLPGSYTLTFTLSGMATVTKDAVVQLQQDTTVNVTMNVQGVAETVNVTAEVIPVISKDSTALKSGVTTDTIKSLPVGQQYSDLVKLIPGVQYSENSTRGPSAGGSGQDNVYKFDGVNVTLPLFGTLSAEPSSYDIAEVSTVKGGTKAVDFNRSGGFTIDSISKTGTSKFSGAVSFQIQPASFVAAQVSPLETYQQKETWSTAGGGGPLIPGKAFFYASYYRPTVSRSNVSNVYGPLPSYSSTRNEEFGKLTLAPVSSVLINLSWRQSHHLQTGSTFGQTSSSTTGNGAEAWQKIGIAEMSWIMNSHSFATFKYTHYKLPTQGRPDHVSSAVPSQTNGTTLDIAHLDTLGLFSVPAPIAGATAYNAFVQPLITQYRLSGERGGDGRRLRRLRHGVRPGQLLPRPGAGRLERHVGRLLPPRFPRRVPVVRRLGGPAAHLEWVGQHHGPRRPAAVHIAVRQLGVRTGVLHGDVLPAGGRQRGADPLRVPLDELRGQRHDQLQQRVDQSRHDDEPRQALRPGAW